VIRCVHASVRATTAGTRSAPSAPTASAMIGASSAASCSHRTPVAQRLASHHQARPGRDLVDGPLRHPVEQRRLVFDQLDISATARRTLDPGVTWWGWHVPALVEVAMVLLLGVGLLSIAIWEFSATE
jgi:hypothetical protein